MAVIRHRNTVVAVKFETTTGLDAFGGATPSAATDFMKADVTVAFNQAQVTNPEQTGTLDASASIAGGTKVSLTLTCMAKGSGSPTVAPQWGKLMQICGWQETSVAAIAATALASGTTNSATLAAPYAATAQLYRGMPITLSGNPATPLTTVVSDYTAGRVASLAYAFATPLDNTTQAAIPAHTRYAPVSDPALIKSATISIYMDGIVWKMTGCAGSWKLDVNAGGVGTFTFTITGQFVTPFAASTPTGIVFDSPQPPVFRNGLARLNGLLARVSKASFDGAGTLFEPENPEAVEGFDPSIITSRTAKGQFDL